MLYNVDDENNNYKLKTTERRLNIRKVALFISCVVISFAILMGSFLLTYNSKKNVENSEKIATEQIQTSPENIVLVDNNNENINLEKDTTTVATLNDNKKAVKYVGQHTQIPVHTLTNIQKGMLPIANSNANEEIKQIYYSDEKQVYLTFDDGPSKEVTPVILKILKDYNIPATFFVLGSRVELNPNIVLQEYNEGHYIANHGYSHKYSQLYSSVDNVIDEFNKTENAIQSALGNTNYHSYLFRFPGGSSGGPYNSLKAKAKETLIANGIACTNWNALTGDAEGNTTKEALLNRMEKSIGNSSSVILLMHDAGDKSYTAEALPDVIQYFKDRGYTFKNFYEIYK